MPKILTQINHSFMVGVLSLNQSPSPRFTLRNCNSGRKHSDRLLSSLAVAADDPSAADRLIRKLVAASSKSAAIRTLSLLLSQSSSLAFPIYQRISTARWFKWSPKLAAGVISVLFDQGRSAEAVAMVTQSVLGLKAPRELAFFYCNLIEACSDRGLKDATFGFYDRIKEIPFYGRRPFESMIKGLCLMGMPGDAEKLLEEMTVSGFWPSAFEYRLLVQGYGRLGSFSEMRRVITLMEDAGMAMDTMCANLVLSCYGDNGELAEMLFWIRRMKELGIEFSVRTFNSILNSCPSVVSMVQDLGSLPLSIKALVKKVETDSGSPDEALLVQELVSSPVLVEMLGWSSSEWKLDLHGFHVASAYVIILQWMEELRVQLGKGEVVPLEISVICGSGKHSLVRGESPIKKLMLEVMFRLGSPMKIDRKNIGKFFAKGKAVRDWLC